MFSDDGLSTVGAIVCLIETIVNEERHTTALSDKTANRKCPCIRDVSRFLVYDCLNVLFATLATNIDRVVIHFGVVAKVR